MRIAASELALASAHVAQRSVERRLEMTVVTPARPAETLTLSAEGMAAAAVHEPAAETADDPALPPRLALLRDLLERMLGRSISLSPGWREFCACKPPGEQPRPAPREPATRPGNGLEIHYSERRSESEQLQVEAEGWVETADGQRIQFQLSLALNRVWAEELELDLSTGELAPRKKDPLVINFTGTAAELGTGRFDFDLDQDGQLEALPSLGSGSGFLVLDRNGDGQVNDGGELFGARSGDGFAELSAHDGDHNGWIDENDAVYTQLRLWQPDAQGAGSLGSLLQADVGAISLQRIASAFEYRDASNTPLASLRSTGVYLKESGGAGTVQQLDLFV